MYLIGIRNVTTGQEYDYSMVLSFAMQYEIPTTKVFDKTLKNYISTILGSLRKTLRQVGKEDILVKTYNQLSVNPEKIKCDAYDYEKGIVSAINSFRGEYMVNYSWAEFKTGKYVAMEQKWR